MKRFRQISRLNNPLLIVAFSAVIISCRHTEKQQELALALQQELQFELTAQTDDPDIWFSERRQYCWQRLSATDKAEILTLDSALVPINQACNLLDNLEQKILARYKGQLEDKVGLSEAEERQLIQIEQLTDVLYLHSKKYFYSTPMPVKAVLEIVNPPGWVVRNKKSGDWKEIYIKGNSAYAAMLHLQLIKNLLYQLKQEYKTLAFMRNIPPNEGWDRLFSDYRIMKDTLNPGESIQAMLFLNSNKKTFDCSANSYPYPKGFLLNGIMFPITSDPETGDLVAKIAMPTEAKTQSNSVEKRWAGTWVIGLSPEKDTLIEMNGRLPVRTKF